MPESWLSRRTVLGRVVVGDATPGRRHETAEPERFLEEEVREVLEHELFPFSFSFLE